MSEFVRFKDEENQKKGKDVQFSLDEMKDVIVDEKAHHGCKMQKKQGMDIGAVLGKRIIFCIKDRRWCACSYFEKWRCLSNTKYGGKSNS